jgi:hypothetical protein
VASFDTGSALPSLSVNNVPFGSYFVRVRARNGSGLSAPGNEVLLVVGQSCAVPAAPTNLRSCTGGTTLNLTWTGTPSATSYILEAGSSPGASNLSASDIGPGTSLTATAPPGTYYIRLRAKSACGASSVSNEIIVATHNDAPIVDQSYAPPHTGAGTGQNPTFTGLAQTFTVGTSGLLSDVAVRAAANNLNNVKLQIRGTSGGIPTSQVLINTSFSNPATNEFVRVNLSSFGLCANAGDVLAIVLPATSAGGGLLLWEGVFGSLAGYAGGQGFKAADNGASSPINQPVGDFAFQTYVSR